MKRSTGVLLFLACALSCLPAQKTRFGQSPPSAKPGTDYPLQVHVSGMRVRTECSPQACANTVYADALLSGQKIELSGAAWLTKGSYQHPLLPGNYQARLLKSPRKIDGVTLLQEYELVFPDRTIWRCAVTGLFE